jgi:hypothetical protein
MSITYKEYNEEIKRLADEIQAEVNEHGGDLYDLAHQAVDGHQWVVYYTHNNDLVYISDNADAWEDVYSREDIGALVVDRGIYGAQSVQAFFAMLTDLMIELKQTEAA